MVVISSSQVLLSAVLDVELVSPTTVVPKGTTIAVRHFLSVPSCQEVKEAVQDRGNCHSIMKVTRGLKNKLDFEVIHSEGNITSSYISTDKFQNKALCQILVAWVPWGNEKAECLHPSLKNIVVTKHKEVCSHAPFGLALYCYCEAALNDFEKLLKMRCHEPTGALMVQNIAKKVDISYDVSVKLAGLVEEVKRTISHLTLCKYNGVKQLEEAIQDRFDCDCDDAHCGRARQIKMTAIEQPSGEVSKYSNIVVCGKTKSDEKFQPPVALRRVHSAPAIHENAQALTKSVKTELSLQEIMEQEIIKPHRPGITFSTVQ